jgi:hypothetical protein
MQNLPVELVVQSARSEQHFQIPVVSIFIADGVGSVSGGRKAQPACLLFRGVRRRPAQSTDNLQKCTSRTGRVTSMMQKICNVNVGATK